jgi:plasmid maintenance system antidote protein VapI
MKFERVHIGGVVKRKVLESGKSIASFAKLIDQQRQNVEKTIFEKNGIDTDLLVRISEVLDFDFFQYYRQADECNIKDYARPEINEIKEVKASITVQVGQEKKEETFSFFFGKEQIKNI